MSLNAAALEYLADKGLSLADVIEFAKIAERRVDATATERKRRQRAKEQMSHRDVTRDQNAVPPNEYISNPPEISPSPKGDAPLAKKSELEAEPKTVVDAWNDMAKRTGLATLRAFNADRRKALKLRLGEHGLAALIEAIGAIERSEFCRGQNDRNWRADFDFLVDPKKLVRVLEGKYGPIGATPAKPSSAMTDEQRAGMLELARVKDQIPHSEWQRRNRELFGQSERPQRTNDPPTPAYIKSAASSLRA